MEKEDKELEGPNLAREQQWEAGREAHEVEELPALVSDEVRDTGFDHRSRLFDALQLILAGEKVNVTLFYLPQREAHALEALQAAVTGNDSMGEFVFAEDRKALLEQSLAVLQQNLTYGEPSQIAELQSKFDSMSTQVGELREQLVILEDAQEEIEEFHQAHERSVTDGEGDKDDKPAEPKADPGLVDFLAEALFAMAEVSPTKTSTLAGEERPDVRRPSALMDGPEAKHETKKTSLYDDTDAPAWTEAADPSRMHDPAPQRRVVKKQEPDDPKKAK